jgi:hypothetical protein
MRIVLSPEETVVEATNFIMHKEPHWLPNHVINATPLIFCQKKPLTIMLSQWVFHTVQNTVPAAGNGWRILC